MAIWRGEWYKRKYSGTWRNRRTGQVSFKPKTPSREKERTYSHFYSRDKEIPVIWKRRKKFYK